MASPSLPRIATFAGLVLALAACGNDAGRSTPTAAAPERPSVADTPTPAGDACRIEGWIADPSPSGVEVRNAPGPGAAVLGTLPGYAGSADGRGFGVPVQITASRDGWLQVEAGPDDPDRSGLPSRPVYAGSGWMPADAVRFSLQSGQGHAAPDPASPHVIDLGSDWVSEFGHLVRVHGCSGDWVDVDIRLDQRRDPATETLQPLPPEQAAAVHRAWFQGACANQETTCDGP